MLSQQSMNISNGKMKDYLQRLSSTKFEESIDQHCWDQVEQYYIQMVPRFTCCEECTWPPHDVIQWQFFTEFNAHLQNLV
jgi:hypothetical protein